MTHLRHRILFLALLPLVATSALAQTVDLQVLNTETVLRIGGVCQPGTPLAGDSTCVTVSFINNGPDSLTALDADGTYTIAMDGAQVVPISTSLATGTGSGTLLGDSISFTINLTGLEGAETAAQLRGPALEGQVGPLRRSLPLGNTKVGTLNSLNACELADFAAGLLYVNILTDSFPSGEIRGQLLPVIISKPAAFGRGRAGITVDIDQPSKPGTGLSRRVLAVTGLETCFTGALAPGQSASVVFTSFVPPVPGLYNATTALAVSGSLTDPNAGNDNQATQFLVHGRATTPALGFWGLMALVVALGSVTAWSLRRRRNSEVPLDVQ